MVKHPKFSSHVAIAVNSSDVINAFWKQKATQNVERPRIRKLFCAYNLYVTNKRGTHFTTPLPQSAFSTHFNAQLVYFRPI